MTKLKAYRSQRSAMLTDIREGNKRDHFMCCRISHKYNIEELRNIKQFESIIVPPDQTNNNSNNIRNSILKKNYRFRSSD